MKTTILLTGASGMVGRDLVPYLYAHTDASLVLLLHRAGAGMAPADYLHRYHGLEPSPRLRIVRGDVTAPGLGLDAPDHAALTRTVTHVLHAAASTRFDQPLAAARRLNVVGTLRAATFAAACGRLRQFGFVSTVYVAGRRTGVIREDELGHAEGFVNAYEQSKYEAEGLLRSLATALPVAVYRLSTVFGDSRTGVVHNLTAPHHALRILHLGLGALLPGRADYPVDLIPSDFAARTLGRLFMEAFEPGTTLHLAAGAAGSISLGELIDLLYEAFSKHDPAWARRGYPRPAFASEHAFAAFVETVEQSGNVLLRGVLRSILPFAGQLTSPKQFDLTEVTRRLPSYGADLPDVRSYAALVARYCVESQWSNDDASGRRMSYAA